MNQPKAIFAVIILIAGLFVFAREAFYISLSPMDSSLSLATMSLNQIAQTKLHFQLDSPTKKTSDEKLDVKRDGYSSFGRKDAFLPEEIVIGTGHIGGNISGADKNSIKASDRGNI